MTAISDNELLVYLEHLNDKDDGIKRDAIESLNGIKDARILYPLIKSLQDENPGIQQAAIDAFNAFDDEAAVYNVIPLLFDNRINVRNIAQEILEHIGGSGVELMGLHIKDKDENVRKMIADILGKIKGEESTSLLLEMLNDPNNNVRSSAAEGLGMVGDSSAVEHLIKLLNDDEWVAFFAAGALGKIGDKRAITPLLHFIKSSSDYLQITGIEALGQVCSDKYVDDFIGCLEYVSPSAKITVVENLIKITHGNLEKVPDNFVKDKLFNYIAEIINKNEVNDFDSKKDFIQALMKLNSKDSSEYILKLLTGVELDNKDIRTNAIEALKLLGDEDTLIKGLKSENNTCVYVSLSALKMLISEKSVPYMIDIFELVKREIKIEIILALANIGGKEALKFLLDMLSFEDGHIRAAAAKGLGIIAHPGTTGALLSRINKEEYHDVVEEIVNALIEIYRVHDSPLIFHGFISNLLSDRSFVREISLKGLGILGDQNASEFIAGMINDENWRVRRACLETMSLFNNKELLDGLIAGVSDERDEVRMLVAKLAIQYHEEKSVDLLISLLSDNNNRIICKAIEGLAFLKAKKAIPYLIELSTGGDSLVVETSLGAISLISEIVNNANN